LNTSKFINDRLVVIDRELGNVDSDIASFKSSNKLTDVLTETGGYVQEGNAYKQTGLGIENQLSMAKYIQSYLNNPKTRNSLIPQMLELTRDWKARLAHITRLCFRETDCWQAVERITR
jgi:tyrosine-protein kinase Etk/Wzc